MFSGIDFLVLGGLLEEGPAGSISYNWSLMPCSHWRGLHQNTGRHLRLVPGKPSLPAQVQVVSLVTTFLLPLMKWGRMGKLGKGELLPTEGRTGHLSLAQQGGDGSLVPRLVTMMPREAWPRAAPRPSPVSCGRFCAFCVRLVIVTSSPQLFGWVSVAENPSQPQNSL